MSGQTRIRAACSFLLAALAAARLGASGPVALPTFEVDRNALVTLSALPAVLSKPEIRPHLGSGLTTSFLVEVEVRDPHGREVRGTGRIDIRYELWDEVYLVRTFGAAGVSGAKRLPPARSFEELEALWQRLHLPLAMASSLDRGGPWKAEVALSVVPFSQSEQRDAQRWLNDSIAARPTAAVAPSPAGTGTSGVLDLFLGSSIQRRSLVRFDWKVSFRPEAGR